MSVSEEDMKLCFELFDKDGSGTLTPTDCATAVRTLGKCPSGEEMEEILDGKASVDFELFKKVYQDAPTPDFDSVLEAFSTFDMHNGGYMSLQELLHLMKSLGEGLSEKTLAQVQAVAEPDADGQVNYRHFVEKMVKDL